MQPPADKQHVRAQLRAPFPWFGGKSRVAHIVWERFGDVPNFVEPFFGSGAVLLNRPGWDTGGWQNGQNRIETVNDKDCFLSNFWRALQNDPDGVARWADWPVNEADAHSRHLWLINQLDFIERMKTDPDYYDVKIAGWWVWGICQWIGNGWCDLQNGRTVDGGTQRKLPHLGNAGRGINRPSQQRPHLGDAGQGINRPSQKLPHLGNAPLRVLPGVAGRGELYDYMNLLAARLRRVRVCCGDFMRVLGPTPTFKQGVTAIFLDPPYSAEAGRDEMLYAVDDLQVAHKVREWAIENGDNPLLRIAYCSYDNEIDFIPSDWTCVRWKAHGGYGSQSKGQVNENSNRECIFFSPHCLKTNSQPTLFDWLALQEQDPNGNGHTAKELILEKAA